MIIKQKNYSSYETRQLLQYALINDIQIVNVEMNENMMIPDTGTPLGCVEFVRDVMRHMQIIEPRNMSYPDELKQFLRRNVVLNGDKEIGKFIKPVITKQFTGFILNSVNDYDEHDMEQYEAVLLSNDDYWISDKIENLQAEYRFYVLEGKIVGYGRYDDGPDDWSMPDIKIVQEMVNCFVSTAPIAYAIDVGMANKQEILIEVNDCWALGYYKGTLNVEKYFEMLNKRWNQIRLTNVSE